MSLPDVLGRYAAARLAIRAAIQAQGVSVPSDAGFESFPDYIALIEGGEPVDSVPEAFTSGQWTATAGVGQIVINLTALPADGGSSITALQYRLDGGAAVTLSGTGTGSRTISGLTGGVEYSVQVRAVNAVGNGAWSDTKARTPTSVPAAFSSGQWTATAGVEQIELNITALPSNGGSAITALQYRLDGGSWVNLTGTGTGVRTVGSLTGGVEYDVQIRAVNAVGNGAASDTKSRTPTASGGGGTPGELSAGNNTGDNVSLVAGFINQYGSSFHTPGGTDFLTIDTASTLPATGWSTTLLSPNLSTLPAGATITSVQVEAYMHSRWLTPTVHVRQNYRDIQLVGGTIPGPEVYDVDMPWEAPMASGSGDRSASLASAAAPNDGAFIIPSSAPLVAAVQAWADGSRAVPLWLQLTTSGSADDMCIIRGNRVADVADGERVRVRIGYTA